MGNEFMNNQASAAFSVFAFEDYLDVLNEKIKQNRELRGYRTLLAQKAGCQLSYLSQTVAGSAHLTPEHAAGLAAFWNFSRDESEYFINLVHKARAASPLLRELIESRLQELKISANQIESKIRDPRLERETEQAFYYSNWLYSAIHTLVSIPEFQTESAISARLQVPLATVHASLVELEKMKLVARVNGRKNAWTITQWALHNPSNSPHTWMHHANWRQRALLKTQIPQSETIHYTALHTLSRKDIVKLKTLANQFIQESRDLVRPSKEEELVCITLDLFTV
jgi:uncharacterized protein (TIGR02147 family)